ncbi:4143_t:CDS:2 [Dentiscutata erythropus]|uniref:4143_t:CDS:1 n=1 Tax=Dentiscutata erythropus TaxID=1348616 RepID=A0A9N9INT9_9GLOM|nr:4143_t:CDS:2 [Dentiscutata erythropus]
MHALSLTVNRGLARCIVCGCANVVATDKSVSHTTPSCFTDKPQLCGRASKMLLLYALFCQPTIR